MDKNQIKHIINVYTQIFNHLTEHIVEGEFDNLDVSQAEMILKEIQKMKKLKSTKK